MTAAGASEALVAAAYARALQDRAEGLELAPADQLLYEVEMLVQEVNSGASFEQYFRWASLEEIGRAAARLDELGVPGASRLVRTAVGLAFPSGLPASEAEMDEFTGWTPEQATQLALLAMEFAAFTGALTHALAGFYRGATGA